jgi:hypothetical protein
MHCRDQEPTRKASAIITPNGLMLRPKILKSSGIIGVAQARGVVLGQQAKR